MMQRGPYRDFRERLLRREYADARLMERMILRFCCEGDSFEEVKRKMYSQEVEDEITESIADLFNDGRRARPGKRSTATLLTDYLGASFDELFGLLQRTILAERTPGGRWNGFYLHDVYRNKSTFEAIVSKWDRDRDSDISSSVDRVHPVWLEIRAGMLSGRIAGAGWTLEERSEADIYSIINDKAGPNRRSLDRLFDRIENTAGLAMQLVSPQRMSSILQAYCDISNDQAVFPELPCRSSLRARYTIWISLRLSKSIGHDPVIIPPSSILFLSTDSNALQFIDVRLPIYNQSPLHRRSVFFPRRRRSRFPQIPLRRIPSRISPVPILSNTSD